MYALSTVGTDAPVLKHQVISIHSAGEIVIALDYFSYRNITFTEKDIRIKLHFEKRSSSCLRVKVLSRQHSVVICPEMDNHI